MPELPEVETVVRGLLPVLTGNLLMRVDTHRKNLRIALPLGLNDKIRGARVLNIRRRAKYILIDLDNDQTVIVHLGMSGSMVIGKRVLQKHDHVVFIFAKGTQVTFNDPRRFGLIDLCRTADIEGHRFFKNLGPEPFDKKFSGKFLQEKLKNRKTAVKIAIMDQKLVVGVGNIYACEALFEAGIDPGRFGGDLSLKECEDLVKSIIAVLKRAIKAGGSSLRNYVQADGELGYFQHSWAVYGKQGEKCTGCNCDLPKTHGIARITQGGRSTFYCKVKQK